MTATPINVIGTYQTKDAEQQPNRADTHWIVVHHAAWRYAPGTALQSIFNYHASRWPKYGRIGYHEVIQEEPKGGLQRYLVNLPDMQGAGVWGRNEHCYHICAATNFTDLPGQDWIDEIARAVADAKRRYPNALIVGHTEIALPGHGTACPGPRWKAWKPQLLTQVDNLLKQTPAPTIRRFRVLCGSFWLEDRRADAPIANQGRALLQAGDVIAIDDVTAGWAHAANGIGFTPMAALEQV